MVYCNVAACGVGCNGVLTGRIENGRVRDCDLRRPLDFDSDGITDRATARNEIIQPVHVDGDVLDCGVVYVEQQQHSAAIGLTARIDQPISHLDRRATWTVRVESLIRAKFQRP